MKRKMLYLLALLSLCACENLMDEIPLPGEENPVHNVFTFSETAELLSKLPIGEQQMMEVLDAVSTSSDNGFDEEYMLVDLFAQPGRGVGEQELQQQQTHSKQETLLRMQGESQYETPLRDLIRNELKEKQQESATKGSNALEEVEKHIQFLSESGLQIYWPYSENWDGKTLPIITYDPGENIKSNKGWRLYKDGLGEYRREEVEVDEEMAKKGHVWVVNSNEDSHLLPLAYIRKTDPDWGTGNHGKIEAATQTTSNSHAQMTSNSNEEGKIKTLLLKKFTAKRNYDSWFNGGSEFFIKIGAVENFKAKTEEDLLLYKPSITDFMVSVRRKDIGKELDFNALLVSEWTDQLSMCAFMITEDDGGTIQSWNCNAVVKINSKSYGFEIGIPINSRDDIVWRGQLSGKYINASKNLTGHFGDVDLVFDVIEY